jgi:hypothetical protein
MSAPNAATLARWLASLELLAKMPPAITANLVNPQLLADVALVLNPGADPVDLRVLILWAAGHPAARLVGELAHTLNDSVPGARPVLSVIDLPSGPPVHVVREQLGGAHALVLAVGYYELAGGRPSGLAMERLGMAAGWLTQARRRLGPDSVTIAVDGRTTRRSDPLTRADWIHQKAVERLGMPCGWPADVIVETGPEAACGSLAERALQPYRADLALAHAQATYGRVRHAVGYTKRRCAGIRRMTDAGANVPLERRWIWLQAHAAGQLADTVASGLDAHAPRLQALECP